ncbi:MAG TPA: hypothetical protein PLX89_14190 [Verrucomicrobiota bacterium]|nr:hypothetical protein [Verrucomicrobiota bacterium]
MPFEEVDPASPAPDAATPQDRACAETQDPELRPAVAAPPTGQLLLGTDKRNPLFAVYEDESGEQLLVFYGFEILEIVPQANRGSSDQRPRSHDSSGSADQ